MIREGGKGGGKVLNGLALQGIFEKFNNLTESRLSAQSDLGGESLYSAK